MQSSSLVQDRSTEAIQHAKAWGNNSFQNLLDLTSFCGIATWEHTASLRIGCLVRGHFNFGTKQSFPLNVAFYWLKPLVVFKISY